MKVKSFNDYCSFLAEVISLADLDSLGPTEWEYIGDTEDGCPAYRGYQWIDDSHCAVYHAKTGSGVYPALNRELIPFEYKWEIRSWI